MKHLNNWLSANKIYLNVEKTELIIFKSPRKVLPDETKIKLSGKRLYPWNSTKYLGGRIDRFLHWHDQVNSIAVKLNRANSLLLKIRNYVNMKTLRKDIDHSPEEKSLSSSNIFLKFGDRITLENILFLNPSTGKSFLYFMIGLHFQKSSISMEFAGL